MDLLIGEVFFNRYLGIRIRVYGKRLLVLPEASTKLGIMLLN